MTAGDDPKKFTKKFIDTHVDLIAIDCDPETKQEMIASLYERSWSMCKHFLDYLITALRRKS